MLSLRLCSSLEKIFLEGPIPSHPWEKASCLGGEEFSFQAVVQKDGWGASSVQVTVDSPLASEITLFQVGQVPCALPAYPTRLDEDYLTSRPGLFPDPLLPLEGDRVEVSSFYPTVLWVSVQIPPGFPGGVYPISLQLSCQGEQAEATFSLQVVELDLPPQRLRYTQWIHGDCLGDYYGVPIYSEAHWNLWEAYLTAAVQEGVNTVLTPLFTPPLDTEPGTERPCVQLVEVDKEGDAYRFSFARLERFLQMAQGCGVRFFEMSHLFTQWGAAFAPAIYGVEHGVRRRLFGWDTPAVSQEYQSFLRQFLPALVAFLEEKGLAGRVMFHLSDEPSPEHLESYSRAKALIKPFLGDFPLYDALSDPAYYDSGLVEHPVAATDHIDPFLERQVPGLWAYTCCGQCVDVGNRFLAMPSARNRIVGWQLYKYRLAGFLHWGNNFWYSQNSRQKLDPWRVTDGGGAFPGGDPFSVYPGKAGPVKSLRMKVFHQGLQDLRALELAETRLGCDVGSQVLPGYASMTFSQYPRQGETLLAAREKLQELLQKTL